MATAIAVELRRSPSDHAQPAPVVDIDAALMLRVRDGDAASFNLLSARHRASVIRFLYRMVRNQAIAEELTQDVFLRVYRSREAYQPSARFTSWLFCIATNRAFNWLRDQRSRRSPAGADTNIDAPAARGVGDGQPSVEARLMQRVKRAEIRRAILQLPAKQRAAVLMHKYEELQYAQIAGRLGCSQSAVKSLIFRAYESLRERLADYA